MPRILLNSPVRGIEGKFKNSDVVYFMYNDRAYARQATEADQPDSSDQTKIRGFLTIATRNWDNLTQAERVAWQNYAALYFAKDENGLAITPSGIATYARTNSIRQVLGLPLMTSAPTLEPPSPINEVLQVGAQNPTSIGLTIVHSLPSLVGLQLLVRATPAMPTVARTPRKGQHSLVRGVSPDSAQALPASGDPVTFTPTKYVVNDGQRYGVEVRVVRTADGTLSKPVYGDFLKAV